MIKMVEVNPDVLAPCGLYCGVCAILIAHKENNVKFKEKLVPVYAPFTKSVEDIECKGCLSNECVAAFCQVCDIKKCVNKKGIKTCAQCDDFPCKRIKRFVIPVGKKVIMRAIPRWKELIDEHGFEEGTAKWVAEEEERYTCECGNQLFRGAKRCNKCKTPVDVD